MALSAGKAWRRGIIIGRHDKKPLAKDVALFDDVYIALAKHHHLVVDIDAKTYKRIGPHQSETLVSAGASNPEGCLIRICSGAGLIVASAQENRRGVPPSQLAGNWPGMLRPGDWAYFPPRRRLALVYLESKEIGAYLVLGKVNLR